MYFSCCVHKIKCYIKYLIKSVTTYIIINNKKTSDHIKKILITNFV